MGATQVRAIREWARQGGERLRGGPLTPWRLAGSVALGLFVGCLPLYGAHLPLCVALGLLLRLDILVAYGFAHISSPPFIPFLLFGSVQLGHLLLSGEPAVLSLSYFEDNGFQKIGADLLVGSLALGVLVGASGGIVAYAAGAWWLARRERRLADPIHGSLWRAIAATASRYRNTPRAHRYYVAIKLRTDPLVRQLFAIVARREPFERVLDIGAGRGQFSLLLHELGACQSSVGFDHDTKKIEVARAAAVGLDSTFEVGDLREGMPGSFDAVLLFDVLHYLPPGEQARVLGLALQQVAPSGCLLLRDNNQGAGWRARLAEGFEWCARALGINRGEGLHFWSPAAMIELLVEHGFSVEVYGERSSNVLLVATHQDLATDAEPRSAACEFDAESSELE